MRLHNFLGCVSLFLIASGSVFGVYSPSYYWGRYCRGNLEIIGEYLYVRPHLSELGYVIEDDRSIYQPTSSVPVSSDLWLPSGKEITISPDYQSAFRVGFAVLFNENCHDIEFTYSRLRATDRSQTAAVATHGLWITDGHPRYNNLRLNNPSVIPDLAVAAQGLDALAAYKTHFNYNQIDGMVGSRLRRGCSHLRGLIGLRWAQLWFRDCAQYQGTLSTTGIASADPARVWLIQRSSTRIHSGLWGIGPRLGLEFQYTLCCGLGFGVRGAGSLLVGEARRRHSEHVIRQVIGSATVGVVTDPPNVDQYIDVPTVTHVQSVAEFDARMGIHYTRLFRGYVANLELGWEFTTYLNALNTDTFNGMAGTGETLCESFSFDGLYVSVKIGF